MEVARQIYWNIDTVSKVLMYLLFVAATVTCGVGVNRRIQYWRQAKPDTERWPSWGSRLGFLLGEILLQRSVSRKGFPGVFHGLIFYSFLACVLATTAVFIDADITGPLFDWHLFRGWVYRLLSFGADIGGLLILVGLGMAAYRRYIAKAENLERKRDDAVALGLLAGIIVTGFALEAIRIHHTGEPEAWTSIVGYALALPFGEMGATAGEKSYAHLITWWVHMVMAMGFIALIPYTKFFHLLAIPTGVLKARLTADDPLPRMDLDALMEDEDFDYDNFSLGMGSEKEFTFENRVDHDACIECGRCQDVCPASRAGDPFGPKDYIGRLRDYGKAVLAERLAAGAVPRIETSEEEDADEAEAAEGPAPLIGDDGATFDENFVFFCRTCRACMEVCPAKIEHVPSFIEQRRNEVGIHGRMPEEAQAPLRQLQSTFNALGAQEDRTDWIEKTGVRVVGRDEECDVLYFVGCLSSIDVTKQKIAEDLFKVLEAAGVDFGVLGEEETCCGDPARVIGDEMTYQMVAKAQAEAIAARKFKTLLVSCPHCFHNLGNEYKTFDHDFEVLHHSQYIQQLLAAGRITLEGGDIGNVAFHDPCYLGRYQRIFDEPRRVLAALPGASATELSETREDNLCCGAGGGHFWMDFEAPERINNIRMKQAVDAGADVVATGCPFCMQMLVDSVSILDLDDKVQIRDLATLVANALPDKSEQETEQA